MKNTFTNYRILVFILTLSVGQPPHMEASVLSRTLQYGDGEKTWEDARKHCRSIHALYHSDLAIIRNTTERRPVITNCPLRRGSMTDHLKNKCWIGIRMDENGWKWVNNESYDTLGLPTIGEKCGLINAHAKSRWRDSDCSKDFGFVCQMDNLILVKENKTWEEAVDHCRALQVDSWKKKNVNPVFDLLILHTEDEFAYAQSIVREAQTDEVWIGLRWLAGRWLWMDGETDDGVSMPVCPANGMNCGTLSEKGKQSRDCVGRRNFFCFITF